MKNKLIAIVEEISFSEDEAKNTNTKEYVHFNCGVILLNFKELRKQNLYNQINYYNKITKMLNTFQDNLNFINSKKKIRLTPDFNYIELINDTCQYDYECLQLYKNIDPTIFHFNETKLNINIGENSFRKEFFKCYNILKTLQKFYLTIPIVLYSNDGSEPFIYTTMISILENIDKKTFYSFDLFVPSNYSIINKNIILNVNGEYKCIYFKILFDIWKKHLKI